MIKRSAIIRSTILAGGLVAIAGVAAALYGTAGVSGNSGGTCSAAAKTAQAMQPFATGAVAAFDVQEKPAPLPLLTFTQPDGAPIDLSAFRGRTILLNLWATWCAPCKEEMPALDALQAQMGSEEFEVVAVNIDTRHVEKPKAWLKENQIQRLAYYSDRSAKIFQELKAVEKAHGMPTTLLIDGEGCELGLLSGPADWASPEAKALVGAALRR